MVEAIQTLGNVSEGSFDEGTVDDAINGMANMGNITDERVKYEKTSEAFHEIYKRLIADGKDPSKMTNQQLLDEIKKLPMSAGVDDAVIKNITKEFYNRGFNEYIKTSNNSYKGNVLVGNDAQVRTKKELLRGTDFSTLDVAKANTIAATAMGGVRYDNTDKALIDLSEGKLLAMLEDAGAVTDLYKTYIERRATRSWKGMGYFNGQN